MYEWVGVCTLCLFMNALLSFFLSFYSSVKHQPLKPVATVCLAKQGTPCSVGGEVPQSFFMCTYTNYTQSSVISEQSDGPSCLPSCDPSRAQYACVSARLCFKVEFFQPSWQSGWMKSHSWTVFSASLLVVVRRLLAWSVLQRLRGTNGGVFVLFLENNILFRGYFNPPSSMTVQTVVVETWGHTMALRKHVCFSVPFIEILGAGMISQNLCEFSIRASLSLFIFYFYLNRPLVLENAVTMLACLVVSGPIVVPRLNLDSLAWNFDDPLAFYAVLLCNSVPHTRHSGHVA